MILQNDKETLIEYPITSTKTYVIDNAVFDLLKVSLINGPKIGIAFLESMDLNPDVAESIMKVIADKKLVKQISTAKATE